MTFLPVNKKGDCTFEYEVTDGCEATAKGPVTIPVESSCPPLSADQKQEAVKKVFYADTFLKIFNLAQEINSNISTWNAETLKAKYDVLKDLEKTLSGLPGVTLKGGKELSCFTKDTITGRAAYCTGGATGSNPSQANYKYSVANVQKDVDVILKDYLGTPSVEYDAKKNFADALTIAGGDKDCLKEIVIDSCIAHSGSNACNTLVASFYDWAEVNTLA